VSGAFLSGCGVATDSPSVMEVEHSDSAGVRIVTNRVDASDVRPFATLEAAPDLRLGALEGRPDEQFGRVADVLPLADGGVAVADAQAAEIRLFDEGGRYRSSLGSEGPGPGEFRSLTTLGRLTGDTLAAFDAALGRVTRFGPDGLLGRVSTLAETRGGVATVSFLSDGGLVGQGRWLPPEGGPLPGSEPTLVRDTVVLMLFDTEGAVDDTIHVVAGRESIASINVGDGVIQILRRSAAFGRTNVFAVHPEGIWSSSNDRFELQLWAADRGRLLRIVRAPGLERPLADGVVTAVRERAFAEADSPEARRRAELWLELSPRPEILPAYDLVVVDDVGRLWVRAWSAPDPGTRWWVFAAGGELLGYVDVPSGVTITAVRCGSAWGVERDELDVSYVVRYAFRESGSVADSSC
jgi:hypothetical protein